MSFTEEYKNMVKKMRDRKKEEEELDSTLSTMLGHWGNLKSGEMIDVDVIGQEILESAYPKIEELQEKIGNIHEELFQKKKELVEKLSDEEFGPDFWKIDDAI
jgi:hypothetical protein